MHALWVSGMHSFWVSGVHGSGTMVCTTSGPIVYTTSDSMVCTASGSNLSQPKRKEIFAVQVTVLPTFPQLLAKQLHCSVILSAYDEFL